MTAIRLDSGRLILLAGLFACLLLCCGPIIDPDLPWHLASGRLIVATASVPRQDPFSWTMAGKPWIDFEWGSQVIFYGVDKIGSTTALWLFKSAAFLALTLQFVSLLKSWRFSRAWIGLAAPAFAAALFPISGLRPEIFSMLFFLLELQLLERRRLGILRLSPAAWLGLQGGLYAVWANLHAGFITGLLLCYCYGAGELFGQGTAEGQLPVFAFAVAGCLGTLANPYGYRIYSVLFDHMRHINALRELIVEWEKPSLSAAYLHNYWLILSFSLAGVLFSTWQGAALPLEHVVAVVVFALFSSRASRTTNYAVLLVYPLGLAAWHRSDSPRWWTRARAPAVVMAVALVVWRSLTVFTDAPLFFLHPFAVKARGPERACAFLRAEKAALGGLNFYNQYNWGGYFDYFLYPDYKVFMDGRYLFARLLSDVNDAEGDPLKWRTLMEVEKIELAVLHNDGLMMRIGNTGGRPFAAYAMPRPEWALVYWDSDAAVYVRRSKAPPEWLARHEYRWLQPHDLREASLYVVSGAVPLKKISDEIDRYAREIGDAREVFILKSWRAEFIKGLAKAAAKGPGRHSRGSRAI